VKSLNDLLRSTKPVSVSKEINAAALNPVVWPTLARSNIKKDIDNGACSSDIGGDQSVKPSGSFKLNNELRTAVLSAVHGEFKSISQRSMNVLVSGLPIRGDISDSDQFVKLCEDHFGFRPNIRSLVRLGDVKKDKIQPLLVSLKSKDEADHLIEYAKVLRTASDKLIRDQVYFNKHLTRAEAAAAFEARERFREKKKRDSLKQSTLQSDQPSKSSPTISNSSVPPLIDLSMDWSAGGLKDHPLMIASASGGGPSTSSISLSVDGASVSSDSVPPVASFVLMSSQSAPSQSAPSQSAPSQSAPSQSAPSLSAPSQSAPSQSAPSQSSPSQSAPSQSGPPQPPSSGH